MKPYNQEELSSIMTEPQICHKNYFIHETEIGLCWIRE